MEMTLELLATLSSDSDWTLEEDNRLKRVERIAALVVKVKTAIGTRTADVPSQTEDDKLISRFLKRSKAKQ